MPIPLQKRYLTLTHAQQSVFWTNYSIQMERLEASLSLGRTARRIIERIKKAPTSRIPYIGAMLYKMQHGEIQMKEQPNEDEWRRIWEVYRGRKEKR